jgi:hypothetical protein
MAGQTRPAGDSQKKKRPGLPAARMHVLLSTSLRVGTVLLLQEQDGPGLIDVNNSGRALPQKKLIIPSVTSHARGHAKEFAIYLPARADPSLQAEFCVRGRLVLSRSVVARVISCCMLVSFDPRLIN